MDPNLADMNAHDLFWYARNTFGITNFGQYNGFPTKEQCLEAIKLYYDTKDLPDAKSHKVTKKKKSVVEANVETNQNQNETIRRRTRRNQVTENVSTVASRSASIDEAAKNQETVTSKELKKKTKKVKKSENNESATVQAVADETEKINKPKKTTKKKKTEALKKQEEPKIDQEQEKISKAIPAKIKQTETLEAANEELPVKIPKKRKQKSANEQAIEGKNEPKSAPIKEKKVKKSSKKNTKAKQETMPTSDTIANTDTNQSDDFNLRLDADEQEAPGKLTPLANQSIMTNDDSREICTSDIHEADSHIPIATKVPNQTKTILNGTFTKLEENKATASNKTISNEESIAQQQSSVSSLPCSSFYTNNSSMNKAREKNRARIVKPKIKITNVETASNLELATEKVEIVQREAGPRIVKPPEATKTTKTTKTSKTHTSNKVPDFKAIHAKNDEKLESLSDNQQRVMERHKEIFDQGSKASVAQKTIGIPQNKTTSNMTTPLANKPKQSTVLPSAKPYPFKPNDSLNIGVPSIPMCYNPSSIINFTAGTTNLLATSSFNRRKSFNLNASLMRPLNYKRHTGKLKPLEQLAPGIGVKQLKTAPSNLNEKRKEERKEERKKLRQKATDENRVNI